MTHYGSPFAVFLCRWIGHRDPLIARLCDPAVRKDRHELEYLAEVLGNPKHRWPTPKRVAKNRKHLHRAAVYLEFLCKGGEGGKKMAAQEYAARQCDVNLSTLRRSLDFAEALGGGAWWKAAARLARKRKLESLHKTY